MAEVAAIHQQNLMSKREAKAYFKIQQHFENLEAANDNESEQLDNNSDSKDLEL